MSLKQCGQCNEMIDEAKAFCLGCGSPFVTEETRRELTEHDSFDGTMKLSQSAYNILLSGMELDVTEQPEIKSKPDIPVDKTAADLPEAGRSNRFVFVIAGAGLLILAIVILVFFVAPPFSK